MNIYTIEGSIGCGKSTLMSLAKITWASLNISFLDEPIEVLGTAGNLTLEDYYKSMKENAKDFQNMVINLGFTETIRAKNLGIANGAKILITDRGIFSPLAFTRIQVELGHISRAEYKLMKAKLVERAIAEGLIPSKMVLFVAPTKLLLARIAQRGRKEEVGITSSYLHKLEQEQLWLGSFLLKRFGTNVVPVRILQETKAEDMLKFVSSAFILPKPVVGLYKKFAPDSALPTKSYTGDVGLDLVSSIEAKLGPGARQLIKTGLGLTPPAGHYFQLFGRSSLSKMGLDISGGVVDPGYRGEIGVILINNSEKTAIIEKGARIAQAVPIRCAVDIGLLEDQSTEKTQRSAKGFGSSDAKETSPVVRFC